jgi:hypothetical protein
MPVHEADVMSTPPVEMMGNYSVPPKSGANRAVVGVAVNSRSPQHAIDKLVRQD